MISQVEIHCAKDGSTLENFINLVHHVDGKNHMIISTEEVVDRSSTSIHGKNNNGKLDFLNLIKYNYKDSYTKYHI